MLRTLGGKVPHSLRGPVLRQPPPYFFVPALLFLDVPPPFSLARLTPTLHFPSSVRLLGLISAPHPLALHYTLLYCLPIGVHTLENLFPGLAVTAVTVLSEVCEDHPQKAIYSLPNTLLAIKGLQWE